MLEGFGAGNDVISIQYALSKRLGLRSQQEYAFIPVQLCRVLEPSRDNTSERLSVREYNWTATWLQQRRTCGPLVTFAFHKRFICIDASGFGCYADEWLHNRLENRLSEMGPSLLPCSLRAYQHPFRLWLRIYHSIGLILSTRSRSGQRRIADIGLHVPGKQC